MQSPSPNCVCAIPPSPTYLIKQLTPVTLPPNTEVSFPFLPSTKLVSTMASCPSNCWEVPKFNFNSPYQSEDWKVFYTRDLDYLEALNINTDEADNWCTCWKQLKMMFQGEDRRLSSPSSTMGPSPWRVRGCPKLPLILLVLQ